jgi:glycosyltransferase involved in cell wall biosynthesis
VTALHQIVPVLSDRDATGHHTLEVQRLLRAEGMESEVFAIHTAGGGTGKAHPLDEYDRVARPGAVLLYQCSVGSEAAEWCRQRPERLVVNYHNMTPARFFDPWHAGLAAALREGRHEVASLAGRTELAVCDSQFNADELVGLGFARTVVAPVLLDLAAFDVCRPAGDARPAAPTWLCVGRLVPNKGQHALVSAFAAWCAATSTPGALVLVGGGPALGYERAVRRLVADLGLADRVRFTGSVTHDELVTSYRDADVFVSLSEHEGFCVPVVEAMQAGVPVVALAAAAVPETVGDAALLVPGTRPLDVAAAVERVLADDGLRAELVRRGRARAASFALARSSERFLDALRPLLGR